MKKNLAFTLAETLIVIAIIGVVAALTLPNLNSSTADKEKVTKVKKIYAALTEATDRAVAVYGPIDGWFNDLATEAEMSKRAKDRITEFMKVSKDCGQGTGCWSTAKLYSMGGEAWAENYYQNNLGNDDYFVNLSDGMSLAFDAGNGPATIYIEVDIDGPNKGKTTYGNDIFWFSVKDTTENETPKGQLIPDESPEDFTGTFNDFPAAWIINNDNADYLKADCSSGSACVCPDGGNLNWETKTSCN